MRQYNFYDTDSSGKEEYDITGTDYFALLEVCFRYCSTVSLLLDLRCTNCDALVADLEEDRLPVTENVRRIYDHYGVFTGDTLRNYEIRHYNLSDAVKNRISTITDSVFKWLYGWGHNNPADPAFFRDDGSVFFRSLVHEGVCSLHLRHGEDVHNLLHGKRWHYVTGE